MTRDARLSPPPPPAGARFRSLLPAPWLSLALFGLWLVLNQSLSPGHLLLGAAVAVAGPLATRSLRPSPVRLRRPLTAMRLLLTVGHDVVASNLAVARQVLQAGSRPPRSAFVEIPLSLRDPNALAALSMITAVIPGTVWSELALDRSRLLIHVFDVPDAEAFVDEFKRRYERPLMEVFG